MASSGKFETIVDIFKHSIPAFPTRPLFGVKKAGTWQWTTYAEFGKAVDRARRGLAELGVGKADKIDWVEITWPQPSGKVRRIENPPLNRYIAVSEA